MHQFFVKESQINEEWISITGLDVNHIKNVLRLHVDDDIILTCSELSVKNICRLCEFREDEIIARVKSSENVDNELNSKIYLFQGLPKSDKMELIIQKAVELGVYEIIPVSMKRSIVKLDEKKEETKRKRWQLIAESAAKQSKRGIIPNIAKTMTFSEALYYSENFTHKIIPYENEKEFQKSKMIIQSFGKHESIGVFIGPEGGFAIEEVEMAAEHGVESISLGKRILRTETAGLTILSIIMFQIEE